MSLSSNLEPPLWMALTQVPLDRYIKVKLYSLDPLYTPKAFLLSALISIPICYNNRTNKRILAMILQPSWFVMEWTLMYG